VKVSGLDLSLASTGVANLHIPDPDMMMPGDRWRFWIHRIESDPVGPNLRARSARYGRSRDRIRAALKIPRSVFDPSDQPDLVVVEGPALAAVRGAHEIGWHWGKVVDMILSAGVDVLVVPPSNLKQYVTGSGATSGRNKVTKAKMHAALCARYGVQVARAVDGQGSDVVDAFGLAALGARVLGRPIEPDGLPEANLKALDKLDLSGLITSRPDVARAAVDTLLFPVADQ
jgi:hypothetical protein